MLKQLQDLTNRFNANRLSRYSVSTLNQNSTLNNRFNR